MADAVRFSKLCHDAGPARRRVQLQRRVPLGAVLPRECPQAKDWVVAGRRRQARHLRHGRLPLLLEPQPSGRRGLLPQAGPSSPSRRSRPTWSTSTTTSSGPATIPTRSSGSASTSATTFTPSSWRRWASPTWTRPEPPAGRSRRRCCVRAWQDFCCRSLAESYWAMSRYARSLRPDVLVECNPNGVAATIHPPVDHGRLLQGGEAFWVESGRVG